MIADFFNYKIEKKPAGFGSASGVECESTACISFHDEKGKELAYFERGYCEAEKIFEKIDKEEEIDLDECFIENFSMEAYRKSRGLGREDANSKK